jgi:hypothetical protein
MEEILRKANLQVDVQNFHGPTTTISVEDGVQWKLAILGIITPEYERPSLFDGKEARIDFSSPKGSAAEMAEWAQKYHKVPSACGMVQVLEGIKQKPGNETTPVWVWANVDRDVLLSIASQLATSEIRKKRVHASLTFAGAALPPPNEANGGLPPHARAHVWLSEIAAESDQNYALQSILIHTSADPY